VVSAVGFGHEKARFKAGFFVQARRVNATRYECKPF
jgi:hypothetical protein